MYAYTQTKTKVHIQTHTHKHAERGRDYEVRLCTINEDASTEQKTDLRIIKRKRCYPKFYILMYGRPTY